MDNKEDVQKKPFYKKWWVWGITGVLVLFIIIGSGGDSTTPTSNVTNNNDLILSYRVIDEEDISYLGCKKIGLRIVVPDDAIKENVDFTLGEIVEKYKADWEDITVWAYRYSEESQVGLIGFTKCMKEYSTCG